MSCFSLRPLCELAEINPKIVLAKGIEYPFVAMEDLTPGVRFVRAQKRRLLTGGARFRGGDTLFARITPCLENGKISQYDPKSQFGFGSTEFIVIRARCGVADPVYIHYLATTDFVRKPAIGSMSGASGRQRADAKIVSQTLVPAPDLDTQRRIASILEVYDDLIEVNRRRIAVLEEMARGLFEEWFVRFRFPGHEAVAIENTPDGSLPAGWNWGRFADLASQIRDTVLPESIDPATPYIGLEHISRRSTTLAEHGTAADVSSLKARFRRGDILFGKIRPYFHKIAWAPFDGVASTDAIIWRPTAALAAQALLQASSDAFVAHSVQTSNGTKMPRANTKVLADYRCALAPSNISERFENTVGPMIEFAASLQAANLVLAASRDLLLPRLISGQLSVTQVERELWAA